MAAQRDSATLRTVSIARVIESIVNELGGETAFTSGTAAFHDWPRL